MKLDVMFICDDEVADANMLWPWWIYEVDPDIVGFHDLTILLMHESIRIDKLMFWMMMNELTSHSEGETIHKVSASIVICIRCLEDYSLLIFSDNNRKILDVVGL